MSKPLPPESEDDAVIGYALRWSLAAIIAVLLIGGLWVAIRYYMSEAPREIVVEAAAPKHRLDRGAQAPRLPLTDVTEEAGIDFEHSNGAAGEKLLPETMGSGAAWLDYDNDGDQDLLLVNGQPWPWSTTEPSPKPTCRLYANDGTGKFKDVSAETGMDQQLYGMGVAIGDYDNDGWCDVFLSAVGENRLLRNDSGVFRDATQNAGVGGSDATWSTSCGFVDYDNDGRLDLLVCNYVEWSREKDLAQSFTIDGVHRAYGPPRAFGGTFPYLYHNEGEGRFVDVSEQAGMQVRNPATNVPLSKAMGLAPVDVNDDGFLDFIIANDTVQNFLLVNGRDGTFQEAAELSGIAYDRDGNARGAMGIDAAAIRDDGTLAITIGNFANEPTALYVAAGPGEARFNDLAMATGIGPQTRLGLTFGIFFADLDLDGRLDVVGANGHLEQEIHQVQSTQTYAQSPQVFWNAGREGGSQMVPLGREATGPSFAEPMVGRAAAYADMDGDGDLDFIITGNGSAPRLIRNDQSLGHHWLRLRLEGSKANRSAIGARIICEAGDHRWERTVMPTRSYLSQCELPVTIGLGDIANVDSLSVAWPGGKTQVVPIAGVDRVVDVVEE